MGRSAQSKANRKERRKRERAAAKRRKREGDKGDPAGNFLSGMWNAMSWGDTSKEESVDGNDTLKSAGLRGEVSTKDNDKEKDAEKEGGEEESGSWWGSLLPSFEWGTEDAEEGVLHREGDEDNHVDLLSGNRKKAGKVELGAEGVKAELEAEAGGSLVDASGKKEGQIKGPLHGSGEIEGSLGSANIGAKGNLDVNSEGVSAGVEGEIGAHLAKVGVKGKAGLKLPLINAMLWGSGGVEGGIGYGAKGSMGMEANLEKGFSTSGEASASMGLGGGLSYGFGLEKADPEKGWFDSSAERTYPESGQGEDSN